VQNLIIQSIGTATPSVSKLLADAFLMPQEVVLRLLYNTPAPIFTEVEPIVAKQAYDLLTQLGLEVSLQSTEEPLPPKSEPVDIGLYLPNPLYLMTVTEQVANFMGCEQKEALNLLLSEPSIILGDVSMATAEALSKRVHAEVIVSNPKNDLYTIKINTENKTTLTHLKHALKDISDNVLTAKYVENIDYTLAQIIWRRFHVDNAVQIINQSHQRYEIILDAVNPENPNYRKTLIETVGMPDEIIDEVAQNLPLQLDESLGITAIDEKMTRYAAAGLTCHIEPIPFGDKYLEITEITDFDGVNTVLSQFFDTAELPNHTTPTWQSPKPIKPLLARYAAAQLEANNYCSVLLN
jgi:hypothetical protein